MEIESDQDCIFYLVSQNYLLFCIFPSTPNAEVQLKATGHTSLDIGDLLPYAEYSIVVQAVNSKGRGPFTQEIYVSTPEDGL